MKNEEHLTRHDANKSGCNGQIMISSSGERYHRMLWSTARLERVKKLTSPILQGLLNYFSILCFHSLCNQLHSVSEIGIFLSDISILKIEK